MINWNTWNRTVLTSKLRTMINGNTWNRTILTFKLRTNVKLNYLKYILFTFKNVYCPVGWSWRMHELHHSREVRYPQRVSCMDLKQSNGDVPVMMTLWRRQSAISLPSPPSPLSPWVVAPDRALSLGQIELNCVLMLNWIVRNRTVLTFNCVYTISMIILNWIVWNKTVWLNWIAWNRDDFDN